jgi:hypothetical protein
MRDTHMDTYTDGRDLGKDELSCHDVRTKFNKDWFRHSKVIKGDTQTHRHTDRMEIV